MKRKLKTMLILILALSLLCTSLPVYAALSPTGENSKANPVWMKTYTAEARVGNLLKGNIAFANGVRYAWVRDKKVDMGENAVMQLDETFLIPAAFAKAQFGVQTDEAFVPHTLIAEKLGYHSFTDKRGFCLLSLSAEVVNMEERVNGVSVYYTDFYTVSEAIGTLAWEDIKPTDADYEDFITRWKNLIAVPQSASADFPVYKQGIINKAKNYLPLYGEYADGSSPFTDMYISAPYTATQSTEIEAVYSRILEMAKGYYLDGCRDKDLETAILGALKFMHEKYYAPGGNFYRSKRWPTYEYLLPEMLADTLVLMRDILPQRTIDTYINAAFDKNIDPTVHTGSFMDGGNNHYYTNRLSLTVPYLKCAVLTQDAYRVNYGLRYLNHIFEYVDRNAAVPMNANGFYSDGSLVFHNAMAYNLGYGAAYLESLSYLVCMSAGTAMDVKNVYGYDNIYGMIENAFLPFVYKNQSMAMVMGRTKTDNALSVIRSIMTILNYAPEGEKARLTAVLKTTLGDTINEYKKQTGDGAMTAQPQIRLEIEDFLGYAEGIAEKENEYKTKVYHNMDRVVHDREGFRFGLSMSSERIDKYEGYTTSGGLTEWYIGDGMTYIYTDDRKQYTTTWWANANPYYMPGTTVDSVQRRTDIGTEGNPDWHVPENTFAGGVTDGKRGVAGMILGNKYVTGLAGRKSWFMLGDTIVCLGSGITGGEGEVYTVLDNRVIDMRQPGTTGLDEAVPKAIFDYANTSADDLNFLVDGDYGTNWRNQVVGSWVAFDFGEKVDLGAVAIAFSSGDTRKAHIKFYVSDDGANYKLVFDGDSSGTTSALELFEVSASGRYFKLESNGNSNPTSDWVNIPEIKFFKAGQSKEAILAELSAPRIGYEDVVLDGSTVAVDFNQTHTAESASWIWNAQGIGHVLLEGGTLNYRRDIYKSGFPYLISYLSHGTNPQGAGYAYAILPETTADAVSAYAQNPQVEIIERTDAMHALRDKQSGAVYASVFERGKLDGMEVLSASTVMQKKDGLVYTVHISDPTMLQEKIELQFDAPIELINGENVTVQDSRAFVDVSLHAGETMSFSYVYASDYEAYQNGETGKKVIEVIDETAIGGNIRVVYDGKDIDFTKYDSVYPVIENGRTLIPIRALSETVGALVGWEDATRKITITEGSTEIVMFLDNPEASVNGETVVLDVAPATRSDRTMVPLRFASESLGLEVKWTQK